MSFNTSYFYSLIMTLALHGLVVMIFLVHWQFDFFSKKPDQEIPVYINVALTETNPYESKKQKQRVTEQKKSAAPVAQKAAPKEVVQKVVEEKQETVKPLPGKMEKDNERASMENELAQLVAEEQSRRKAVTEHEIAMAYIQQIQADIIDNWSRPPSARNGMQTLLRVFLVPTGELVEVSVEESSGSEAFDRSAVLAVEKAEPFQVPADPVQFERSFRQFTVLFRPEDLLR